MKIRTEYTCPLEMAHDIIRGKWKAIIIWQLSKERKSLSALKRGIKGISQKMLLQHLQELTEYGVVRKDTFEGYPLRVEYYLTTRGEKVFEAITILQEIGIEIMLEDNREEFLKTRGFL